jgi:hypothetical protein
MQDCPPPTASPPQPPREAILASAHRADEVTQLAGWRIDIDVVGRPNERRTVQPHRRPIALAPVDMECGVRPIRIEQAPADVCAAVGQGHGQQAAVEILAHALLGLSLHRRFLDTWTTSMTQGHIIDQQIALPPADEPR